jgi:hypothetical protein
MVAWLYGWLVEAKSTGLNIGPQLPIWVVLGFGNVFFFNFGKNNLHMEQCVHSGGQQKLATS